MRWWLAKATWDTLRQMGSPALHAQQVWQDMLCGLSRVEYTCFLQDPRCVVRAFCCCVVCIGYSYNVQLLLFILHFRSIWRCFLHARLFVYRADEGAPGKVTEKPNLIRGWC